MVRSTLNRAKRSTESIVLFAPEPEAHGTITSWSTTARIRERVDATAPWRPGSRPRQRSPGSASRHANSYGRPVRAISEATPNGKQTRVASDLVDHDASIGAKAPLPASRPSRQGSMLRPRTRRACTGHGRCSPNGYAVVFESRQRAALASESDLGARRTGGLVNGPGLPELVLFTTLRSEGGPRAFVLAI